jgi:hypothetical protein
MSADRRVSAVQHAALRAARRVSTRTSWKTGSMAERVLNASPSASGSSTADGGSVSAPGTVTRAFSRAPTAGDAGAAPASGAAGAVCSSDSSTLYAAASRGSVTRSACVPQAIGLSVNASGAKRPRCDVNTSRSVSPHDGANGASGAPPAGRLVTVRSSEASGRRAAPPAGDTVSGPKQKRRSHASLLSVPHPRLLPKPPVAGAAAAAGVSGAAGGGGDGRGAGCGSAAAGACGGGGAGTGGGGDSTRGPPVSPAAARSRRLMRCGCQPGATSASTAAAAHAVVAASSATASALRALAPRRAISFSTARRSAAAAHGREASGASCADAAACAAASNAVCWYERRSGKGV